MLFNCQRDMLRIMPHTVTMRIKSNCDFGCAKLARRSYCYSSLRGIERS